MSQEDRRNSERTQENKDDGRKETAEIKMKEDQQRKKNEDE